MTRPTRQDDLFAAPQANLFDGVPDDPQSPERMQAMVRPRLDRLLAEARAAVRMPWSAQVAEVNAMLFHNMAAWLPEPEREPLRAAFRVELARLKTGT
jgi:hypothetical protein